MATVNCVWVVVVTSDYGDDARTTYQWVAGVFDTEGAADDEAYKRGGHGVAKVERHVVNKKGS